MAYCALALTASLAFPATLHSEAETADNSEPPSITLAFAVESPTLASISIGKSADDERIEREQAEKQKIAAEKEAERIKHAAAKKKLLESQREQSQANYVHIIGQSTEQCVIYVQRMMGNRHLQGYAGDAVPTQSVPKIGAAALERDYGHASFVVGIEGDYLILHDANYITGAVTERKVPASTQRGYIY